MNTTSNFPLLEDDPLWFKNAVIYQLHLKSFKDGNGDGVGDFEGLTEKLDYLESLGITTIWVLPFYPSPMRDDGYDIADYYDINPKYGTLEGFKNFLDTAHQRGMRVITELVLNHTSDQHPWFQRARRAEKDSVERDYYVWNDTPDKYLEARIIFKDFETSNWTWDPIAKAYYWHRFYSHQPDLNFDNPKVWEEMFKVVDYWFEMGVDGLRLDAVPYLYEREGTNCENLPETHLFLKALRKHIDEKFPNRMLLAEANQWPEDAVAYFGNGDECHMAFHFPVMPRLFMAVQMQDRFPIIDILDQTPAPPPNCQWAMFLRNHDELTLEMVSDEERDYMYGIYAKDPQARINLGIRRRLAPLMGNSKDKIELMNVLLLSLPGTPILYYGDEIGMGDNYYLGDRDGVRTPMQWSPERNAGFSQANPQKLYLPLVIDPAYHFQFVNVENQEQNLSSMLWWVRRMLFVRKKYKAFGQGTLEFILPSNSKVLAFVREFGEEIILVVANLSGFPQAAELDLKKFAGYYPQELLHLTRFPLIKDNLYQFTLAPYGYYWLSLVPSRSSAQRTLQESQITVRTHDSWTTIFAGKSLEKLEKVILPDYVQARRWFRRKTATIQTIKLLTAQPINHCLLGFLEISYVDDLAKDWYFLPLSFALTGVLDPSITTICQVICAEGEGVLYDAVYDPVFRKNLFILFKSHHTFSKKTKLVSDGIQNLANESVDSVPDSTPIHADQSNSAIKYGQNYFLKIYRKLEEGIHSDIEISKFLSRQAHFLQTPPYLGSLSLEREHGAPVAIALLQNYVPNQGSGWDFTLETLHLFYEQVLTRKELITDESVFSLNTHEILEELAGGRTEFFRLLGQRTAEFHLALSSDKSNPAFAPEAFNSFYQRSLYQSLRSYVRKSFYMLTKNLEFLSPLMQDLAVHMLSQEKNILNSFEILLSTKYQAAKMRIHGDYHLGQVIYTGKDFFIIDFEGEPGASFETRRHKRSPLEDVAGMAHSFHYAAYAALSSGLPGIGDTADKLEKWGDLWYQHVCRIFIDAYLEHMSSSSSALFPSSKKEWNHLLNLFIIRKMIYEINYELNNRPDWLYIPLRTLSKFLTSL